MRSRILLTVVGALLPLIVVEGAVRAIETSLPDPAPWPSNETRLKARQMEQLSSEGGADVVFLGTSVTEAAVATDEFPSLVGLTAYNAAVPYGSPVALEIWATDFVVPSLGPEVVVIGLPMWEAGVTTGEDPLAEGLRGVVLYRNPTNLASRIGQSSALVRHRAQLKEFPELLEPSAHPEALGLWTSSGHQTGYYDGRVTAISEAVHNAGDGDGYADGDLDALRRLSTYLTERGIEVVYMIEPGACPPGVDSCASADSRRLIRDQIEALAAETGAVIVDGQQDWPSELFADGSHFNREGTEAFTSFIASELVGLDDGRPVLADVAH